MSVNSEFKQESMDDLITEFWPVQPEPGSVADQLIKKGEAIGEARGEARGEVRGVAIGEARASVKTIHILQTILGIAKTAEDELNRLELDELNAMISSLQQMIMRRTS